MRANFLRNGTSALALATLDKKRSFVNSGIVNIGVGQEWQDTIPEMVPQHPCYQQMKPRHLGLISSLT